MSKYCKCQTNTSNYRLATGELLCCECDEEIKEPQEPQMLRMPKTLKQAIQKSANKHSDGNFNEEARECIRIGLKHRNK
jgi:hypothetical protein